MQLLSGVRKRNRNRKISKLYKISNVIDKLIQSAIKIREHENV